MSKHTERAIQVIVDSYFEGKDCITTKEIAERMGVSPAVAKRAADDAFEAEGWTRIVPTETEIPVVSKNYGWTTGHRMVPAWTVTKRHLANMVVAAQRRCA